MKDPGNDLFILSKATVVLKPTKTENHSQEPKD